MTGPQADARAPGPCRPEEGRLCPSSTCHEGAVVIGVLGEDGRLGYLRPAVPVDEGFVGAARRLGDPESRFRFAGACVRESCEHWSDRRCGLVGRLADAARQRGIGPAAEPPRCAVRAECRWFAQEGRSACSVCPVVVYRPTERRARAGDGDGPAEVRVP
ncbi:MULTISPECIES: hypothetical protein [Streptomyces]|uniref:Uncharacterized protein n=1 Tax=Streptomyces sudanensis TaxID=436397 RepID=A0ABY4TIV8_9ACTN|nr:MULTISPECIES: hypothetical protein [Streptomyces]URN18446.1 hypothetical protein MW084_23670 [Streptomyces sudanensis]